MRSDCKHYQTRTYQSGDTVRKCAVDNAPEAPWRCPDDCVFFEPRLADVNWRHGSLVTPSTPDEPDSVGSSEGVAELLDLAEEIINSVAHEVDSDIPTQAEANKPKRRRWWPFGS